MTGRFPIEDVTPSVACGRYPAKAVVGELVPVSARSYREGHSALGVNVVWTGPDGETRPFTRMVPGEPGTDTWHATIRPDAVGDWTFHVEAWDDPYGTWRNAVTKKIDAGQGAEDLANDLAEGAEIMDAAAELVPPDAQARVTGVAAALRDPKRPLFARVSPALDLADLLWQHPVRLPAVAAMGFDVVYLPPIHPIGRINRKGKNNTLVAAEGDIGSPWAIGAAEGGHDAIHPDLGTLDDFKRFIKTAEDLGLEVAMDLAWQAAPDHPWVK